MYLYTHCHSEALAPHVARENGSRDTGTPNLPTKIIPTENA